MCLYGIFYECNLDWTMFILEGAPFVENFYLARHPCDPSKSEDSAEKTNMVWESSKDLKHLNLKLLVMRGFEEDDKVMNYIRLVMARAVGLKRIELRDKDPCSRCKAIKLEPPRFAVDEASKHRIREHLTKGFSPPVQIIIG